MSKHLLLQPRISEKSYFLSEKTNTYMFDVPTTSNTRQIKEAIEEQYGVKVKNVRTAIAKGKSKTTAVRRRRPLTGTRSDVKRAYVTLMPGKSLPLFEDMT